MWLLAGLRRLIFGRRQDGLVEGRLAGVRTSVLESFAARQADLVRDGKISRNEALAALGSRFPELAPDQVVRLLNRGMFMTR